MFEIRHLFYINNFYIKRYNNVNCMLKRPMMIEIHSIIKNHIEKMFLYTNHITKKHQNKITEDKYQCIFYELIIIINNQFSINKYCNQYFSNNKTKHAKFNDNQPSYFKVNQT